jgi:hypothetical protein
MMWAGLVSGWGWSPGQNNMGNVWLRIKQYHHRDVRIIIAGE